jgi:hypothetical protein
MTEVVTVMMEHRPSARHPGFRGEDGLLSRFIRHRLAQHVEPTRLGTPRGTPVGFTRKKLAAALAALTSADVKQTAAEVRVSYGVVRKWRTEAPFRRLVERLEEEFIESFLGRVDAEVSGWHPNDLMDAPVGEAEAPAPPASAEGAPGDLIEPRSTLLGADVDQIIYMIRIRCKAWLAANLGDLPRYSPRLVEKLARRLAEPGGGRMSIGRVWVLQELLALHHRLAISPDLRPLGVGALGSIVQVILRTLQSPRIAKSQRYLAQVYLGLLQHHLAERT